MNKHDYIKAAHTRQLMSWRDHSYACGGHFNPIGNGIGNFEYTTEEILAELNTRDHVPNKKEAKTIRQQKAKGIQKEIRTSSGYSRVGHNNV